MAKTTNGAMPMEAGGIETESADVEITVLERAAVRRLHARELNIERSAVGVMHAERATLANSSAGVVLSRSAACDTTRVGILAAPVVRGEVHTLIDLRSAFALGLGMALGRVLLAGGRGLVARRRS